MIDQSELLKPANYNAYLVRLWQESPNAAWRASAQCAHTGEKLYFATLAELFTFLETQTRVDPPQKDPGEGREGWWGADERG